MFPTMAELDVAGYLARLGFQGDRAEAVTVPSVGALNALHRAHVERVPYETLEFQMGRPTTVDPYESAARVIANRGGYCFLLNGAFSVLLAALGYDVRWHRGGVQGLEAPRPVGANGNHLVLTVHGLPAAQGAQESAWLVDVGLGDALYAAVPLRPGRYRQGPFEYRLRPSDTEPDGWRLDHDPKGSFAGMDFTMAPAAPADFVEMHRTLSTAPDSGFVRVASVQRRHQHGVDLLRGCTLRAINETGGDERVLDTSALWFAALSEIFGLGLDDLTTDERARLWAGVHESHERWVARAR